MSFIIIFLHFFVLFSLSHSFELFIFVVFSLSTLSSSSLASTRPWYVREPHGAEHVIVLCVSLNCRCFFAVVATSIHVFVVNSLTLNVQREEKKKVVIT